MGCRLLLKKKKNIQEPHVYTCKNHKPPSLSWIHSQEIPEHLNPSKAKALSAEQETLFINASLILITEDMLYKRCFHDKEKEAAVTKFNSHQLPAD